MHQFGHVYALQQELLDGRRSNWFRAVELWHTARHEGIAMNVTHYTNILRQCTQSAQWSQSIAVLQQMRRDGIRPDTVGVGCAMAACADAAQPEAAQRLFDHYRSKMQLDSQCYLAVMKAYNNAGRHQEAIASAEVQRQDNVPMLPATYVTLLEASEAIGDVEMAFAMVRRLQQDEWGVPAKAKTIALKLAAHCSREEEMDQLLSSSQQQTHTSRALPSTQ